MPIALMVVMASWVYTYNQTHQIVYIKCVQFFTCQSYYNKMVFKKIYYHRKPGEGTGWMKIVVGGTSQSILLYLNLKINSKIK